MALTSDACHKGLPKSATGEIPQFKGQWAKPGLSDQYRCLFLRTEGPEREEEDVSQTPSVAVMESELFIGTFWFGTWCLFSFYAKPFVDRFYDYAAMTGKCVTQ